MCGYLAITNVPFRPMQVQAKQQQCRAQLLAWLQSCTTAAYRGGSCMAAITPQVL
jgi:hypothetical protein